MPTTPVTESGLFVDVANELPVIKDSTTSRVIVNNELLRVVQFTFDAGQQLTEHATPKAVTVVLTEGEMIWEMGGESQRIVPGDIVYLAPREPHALTATAPSRMTLVMVNYAR